MSDLTMDEEAIAHHEVFTAYIRAGFSRKEAIELIKGLIIAANSGQP